jgi:hypothetical protein
LPKRHREILEEQQKEYTNWVECPSKYEPEPTEPLCFQREIRYLKIDKNNREFGDSAHTSWEKF